MLKSQSINYAISVSRSTVRPKKPFIWLYASKQNSVCSFAPSTFSPELSSRFAHRVSYVLNSPKCSLVYDTTEHFVSVPNMLSLNWRLIWSFSGSCRLVFGVLKFRKVLADLDNKLRSLQFNALHVYAPSVRRRTNFFYSLSLQNLYSPLLTTQY